MEKRKGWSNDFLPEIIELARKRARMHLLPVNQYLEKLIRHDAGGNPIGDPINEEASRLARIGSMIALADQHMDDSPNAARQYLKVAKQVIFERLQQLTPEIEATLDRRSQENWGSDLSRSKD